MPRRTRRMLAAVTGAGAALAVAAPVAVAAPQDAAAAGRPAFKMPFRCGQTWVGSNWDGHSPLHSVDWNHYDANGTPDDFGRKVLASAYGTVVASYYSTTTGYGNTIVIQHKNGWQTRYAHLSARLVGTGAQVSRGQLIGKVGKSSAKYTITPHLHYEQILNGSTVVAVVQGFAWKDFTKRGQISNNAC
ncbi:M23 family metallopeptidase [Streptomyces sp. NPDC058045]|uniref:M23 family metallopeptidase n=1 Tax=Streptomyces sp. NPDC058045 TaxID=3346311 RepID=UPI0036E61B80